MDPWNRRVNSNMNLQLNFVIKPKPNKNHFDHCDKVDRNCYFKSTSILQTEKVNE